MKILTIIILMIANMAKGADFKLKTGMESKGIESYIIQNKSNTYWLAYQIEAQEQTRSMCCWNSKNKEMKQCDLEKLNTSFGNSSSDGITQKLNIYVKVHKQKVENILTVGDKCKVVAGQYNVKWLDDISLNQSIEWLKMISNSLTKKLADSALYSLANHKGKPASKALFELASLNEKHISKNAIFWIGNSRNDGVEYLQKLYHRLPAGKVKNHINFALTQSKSAKSIEFLKFIALNDISSEQRSDAYFWLAQEGMPDAIDLLVHAINNDKSNSVREKAIFSLSQIDSEGADKALLKIAKSHDSSELKEKALFWLSQTKPESAKEVVLEILNTTKSHHEINNAVFLLSQLSHHNNDDSLFSLLTENYSRQVKKQALFWLSQSENPDTLNKLESLL
ncbi:MAG: HEAT repeat domain-containing protein [Marinicellaceae bacterium]